MFFLSICSSIPPVMREVKENGAHWAVVSWGIHPEAGRNGIDHYILYCPAARHTWCCWPEWDSCSAGPSFWLTSVTCSQPHQLEATHEICVESCSHNHCWKKSFFINWHCGSFLHIAVVYVLGCGSFVSIFAHLYIHHSTVLLTIHTIDPDTISELHSFEDIDIIRLHSASPGSHQRNLMVSL